MGDDTDYQAVGRETLAVLDRAMADAMREAVGELGEHEQPAIAELAEFIDRTVWESVPRFTPAFAAQLSPANRGSDHIAMAGTLLGVMRGAMIGVVRCGRSLGMTPIEVAVMVRDTFASRTVLQPVGTDPPPADEQH